MDAMQFLGRQTDVMVIAGLLVMLLAIMAPLPPLAMDFLLTANITIGVLLLLTTVYVNRPVEFSVLPSLLLVTTFLRLSLNVATTRLILTNAPTMGDEAAGDVVKTFGKFVAGDSPLIGFIIFTIIVIIQFVVITKGATRMSEVAARFTLDSMPGKQMAIDADLNSGLINEADARNRREAITEEADFYGAMDGASKFVRGDAIAGIIITLVNIVGGLVLGTLVHGMTVGDSLQVFTTLTVGDGLVSQLPALLISVGAGLVVSRSAASGNLPKDIVGQMLGEPRLLFMAAAFLTVLLLTPLPRIPLFTLAIGLAGIGYLLNWNAVQQAEDSIREKAEEKPAKPDRVDSLLHVDPMETEIGYGLIRLVDPSQGGDLLERIGVLRRQLALDLGLVVPPIRIRDNMQLEANQYVVKIKGVSVAKGEVLAERFMAMDPGTASGPVDGIETREPAFGIKAFWVTETERARAETQGYTVVEPSSVIATHLTEVIKSHADELLTRDEVANLLDNLRKGAPKLVEELIPEVVKPGELQKVLQNLLREGVSIRDLETILESVGEYAPRTKDPEILTEYARHGLARGITAQLAEEDGKLYVVTLDPQIEELITKHTEHTDRGSFLTLSPREQTTIAQKLGVAVERLVAQRHAALVLTTPQARLQIRRILESTLPEAAVISFAEVAKGTPVETVGIASL